jgi:hypothetical protein
VVLSCGIVAFIAAAKVAVAEEKSSCVACHLDAAMLAKNLSVSTAKKSPLQSGAG